MTRHEEMEELMGVEAHWNGFQVDLYLPLAIPKSAHRVLKDRIDKATGGSTTTPDIKAMRQHLATLACIEIAHMVRCGELRKTGDKWEHHPLGKNDGKDL